MDPAIAELLAFSDAEIQALVSQARAEALVEARIILRRRLVDEILERASSLEGGSLAVEEAEPARALLPPFPPPPVPPPPAPTASAQPEPAPPPAEPPAPAQPTPAPSASLPPGNGASASAAAASADAARLAEIEAIRQKLAANQLALQQIKATPPPAEAEAPAQPAAAPVDETGDGFYVYGIVSRAYAPSYLPQDGIAPDRPPYLLAYQDIQAVVSRAPLDEFGQSVIEDNTHDPAWLESRVISHQAILEALVSNGAVVPMKFCTIYLSEENIEAMLAQYYAEFSAALANLSDKQEWGLKIYSRPAALSRQVEAASERVQAIRAEMAAKSSGMAYFVRKKLDLALSEEAERLSNACAQDSHDRLAACTAGAHILPLHDRDVTGRDDDMALNSAYLVAQDQMAAYRAEMERLQDEYGPQGFVFEPTGPWPPYNFVSIGVDQEPAYATD